VLSISVHSLPGCEVPAELAQANLKLVALGDFAATNLSAEVLPLGRAGQQLAFPLNTRALEARLSDGERSFVGYAERRGDAGIDVLLWPELETCSLFRPDGSFGYPGQGGGQAFGYSARLGLVLAAGGNDALVSDAIVGALTFNVGTGRVSPIDSSAGRVLREPRAFATVSELGENLVVAGGENPVFGVSEDAIEPRDTAEVYDADNGGFGAEPIELVYPRTRHAALSLADGSTLLLGGRSRSGSESYAQPLLERISADGADSSITGLATIRGRIQPSALQLSDGRIFVAGGFGVDGRPVEEPVGEWLTADGSDHAFPGELSGNDVPARFGRAFVAMPGGGVLAVGGCEAREPSSPDEAAECSIACERGCPPANGVYDAFWIDAQGVATAISLDAGRPIVAPRPILLPGSEGAPWLVAALGGMPFVPRLFRFNPWSQRFTLASEVEGIARLPRPDAPRPLSIEPDAFVWLDESLERADLLGVRLGTRNRYAQDVSLVSFADPLDPSRPQHLAPDRAAGLGAAYDGALELVPAGDDIQPTVFITDTDYADFTLTIRLASASVPPLLLVGGLVYGTSDCAWPEAPTKGTAIRQNEGSLGAEPMLRRQGEEVELLLNGGRTRCPGPIGRASIGVRAHPSGSSRILQLDVQRRVD
jgi:hypothetical protein